MGAQWTGPTLADDDRFKQRQHDKVHPGKVCQYCPVTIASDRALQRRRDEWRRREEWRMRWLPWIAGAILVGCWLLGSWLLGPS